MDHMQFKANQTAAGYVANGLDESTQEAFELHLMGCSECVEDVEVWRAIKLDMPRQHPEVRTLVPRRPIAGRPKCRSNNMADALAPRTSATAVLKSTNTASGTGSLCLAWNITRIESR